MLVIARSTEKELARQVSYLKAENQILRKPSSRQDQFNGTREESLGSLRKKLGSALNELATIVHPGTICDGFVNPIPKMPSAKKLKSDDRERLKASRNSF